MSTYSRAQEDRMERKFKSMGFSLVEDTGRRTKGRGDKIMVHDDTGLLLCIDHKSTRGTQATTLFRSHLEKIAEEAEGDEIPCITLSFRGEQKIYVVFDVDQIKELLY